MTIIFEPINVGARPNDHTGDDLRAAEIKLNRMISQLIDVVNSGSLAATVENLTDATAAFQALNLLDAPSQRQVLGAAAAADLLGVAQDALTALNLKLDAPATKPTLPAPATDAASTMALANALRTALINASLAQ
jgi:hypothetical protein